MIIPSRSILLATNRQRSVLSMLDASGNHAMAYTVFGHRQKNNGLPGVLGLNGELPDPLTGHYHLGNGYRQYSPVLMRFTKPDSESPFRAGGLNPYAYCLGDPVNGTDESGRTPMFFKNIFRKWGWMRPSTKTKAAKSGKTALNTDVTAAVKPRPSPPVKAAAGTASEFANTGFTPEELKLKLNARYAERYKSNVATPASTHSADHTKRLLINRRSKSLDLGEGRNFSEADVQRMVGPQRGDETGDFLISMFEGTPHERLYALMLMDQLKPPTGVAGRILRRGGFNLPGGAH